EQGDKISNMELDIDEVDNKITATVEDIERIDDVTNANSTQIGIQAGLISAKLDSSTYKTDKSGILSEIEANKTAITATSEQVNLRVTKEEFEKGIDGIEIGGRNLISSHPDNWTGAPKLEIVSDNHFVVLNPENTTWGRAESQRVLVKDGDTVTAGIELIDYEGRISFQIRNVDDNRAPASMWFDKGDKQRRHSHTWTNDTGVDVNIAIWVTVYGDSSGN